MNDEVIRQYMKRDSTISSRVDCRQAVRTVFPEDDVVPALPTRLNFDQWSGNVATLLKRHTYPFLGKIFPRDNQQPQKHVPLPFDRPKVCRGKNQHHHILVVCPGIFRQVLN
jgi:hypothetical protein